MNLYANVKLEIMIVVVVAAAVVVVVVPVVIVVKQHGSLIYGGFSDILTEFY